MREVIFCIVFIAFTWIMAGIIGQSLLVLSQPKGFDFYVPTKRAIKYAPAIFIAGLISLILPLLPYDQNKHVN